MTGGSASIRSAIGRLSAVLREHPYSANVEDVIYFLAIGLSTLPSSEQTAATANGAFQYLEYLVESYAPSHLGAPTAMLYPRWDLMDVGNKNQPQPKREKRVLQVESGHGGGLCVNGLPAWALQFQIALLAFRLGYSSQAMAAMENSFMSYETWLPRLDDSTLGLTIGGILQYFQHVMLTKQQFGS